MKILNLFLEKRLGQTAVKNQTILVNDFSRGKDTRGVTRTPVDIKDGEFCNNS